MTPLFSGKVTSGHDQLEYQPRLIEFHENIRQGIFLPRWAPDLSSGHGQPLFIFAPPLLMYIAEIWHLSGLSVVNALNAALCVMILLSALFMYKFTAYLHGPVAGLLGAAAYVYGPYFLVCLYVRHALAEFTALAFFPLAMYGLFRAAGEPPGWTRYKQVPIAALGLAGVVLSHPPAALLFFPLFCAAVLFLIIDRRDNSLAVPLSASLILGMALSATAWMPALVERPLVKVDLLLEGVLRWTNHFVFWNQFLSTEGGYGISVPGPNDKMSFSLGVVQVFLALIAIFAARNRTASRRTSTLFFAGAVAIFCFLMTDASETLWSNLRTLQYVQFPWRMLGPASFSLAVVVASVGQVPRLPHWLPPLFIILLALFASPHAGPERLISFNESEWSPIRLAEKGVAVTTRDEYEPVTARVRQAYSADRAIISAGTGSLEQVKLQPEEWNLKARMATPGALTLRSYYYPGWRVQVDGKTVVHRVDPESGFVTVDLPQGLHELRFEYALDTVHWTARILAVLACALLIILRFGADSRFSPIAFQKIKI